MVMFKIAATEQLRLLWIISMMANPFRMLPTNLATNCGVEVYRRVILTLNLHVLTALAAAVLLLAVRMAVSATESNAVTALRMAVCTAECKAIAATHAHHEAATAAVEGVGSITAKYWCRVTLLLAVVLSAASCLLAAMAMEEWFMYQVGCDSAYGVGSPLNVFLMVLIVLIHGSSAWAAVSQN